MKPTDMERIFGVVDVIRVGIATISVEDFLVKLGFGGCEPTKESMLAHDGGKMGYAEFIENGNWEVTE